jgi:protein-tyrosine-phosphatase
MTASASAPLARRLAAESIGAMLLVTAVVGSGIMATRLSPHRHGASRERPMTDPSVDQQLALHTPADPLGDDRTDTRPVVLFLCVHNAGRSQMALGYFNHLAGDRAVAWSGGSEPGAEINPAAVAAMAEIGIDISGGYPKPWTDEMVRAADVVITMGCGDACPVFPGKRYEDWTFDDPAGKTIDEIRPIRDQIGARVRRLLDDLDLPTGT